MNEDIYEKTGLLTYVRALREAFYSLRPKMSFEVKSRTLKLEALGYPEVDDGRHAKPEEVSVWSIHKRQSKEENSNKCWST